MLTRLALPLALGVAMACCAHAQPDPATGGAPTPQAPVAPATAVPPPIVAFGDSITVGVGDVSTPDCRAVDASRAGAGPRLARMEHRPVVNEGVCDGDSFRGRARIHAVLDRWRPGAILILFSPNDVNHELPAVIDNLRFMIGAARQRGVTPVIGTLTPCTGPHRNWEPFVVALNAWIRKLALEERVALADHYRAFITGSRSRQGPESLLAPDGLHPNGRGYDLMAGTWFRALRAADPDSPPPRPVPRSSSGSPPQGETPGR